MKDTYPAHSPAIAFRVVDGEAVIVQSDKGLISVLNGVGSRIWELSDGTRTLSEIAEVLAAEYQVDLEEARSDAQDFVTDLLSQGMLVARKGGRAS